MKTEHYKTITNQIIESIETGRASYKMPWINNAGLPMKAASDEPYKGINVLSLWCEAQSKGYKSNYWGGFGYWKKQGGTIRKGSKSTIVVHCSIKEKENKKTGEIDTYPISRSHRVFNRDQVDGLPQENIKTFVVNDTSSGDTMITLAKQNDICLNLESHEASYSPTLDRVGMPARNQFFERESISADVAYASTLGHELVHATGHLKRLNRDLTGFGSASKEKYAREELIAELGAAFLCGEFGFKYSGVDDHAGYIEHWLEDLKNDHSAIFTAAGQASKAVNSLTALQVDKQ